MNLFLILNIIFFTLLFPTHIAMANEDQGAFTRYMLEWREKSEIAQNYLREGEREQKSGVKYKACLNQRLASKYGVEAFEALINAQQYTETDKQLINVEQNLERMKRIGNCSTVVSLFSN
mgnify:CR=1 FL=1